MNFFKSLYVIIYFLLIAQLYSCRKKYSPKVENAIELAGENGNEIIKVLEHYERNPGDSLKLQAALYLIENMKDHFTMSKSAEVPEIVKRAFERMDSLTLSTYFRASDSLNFKLADFLHSELDTDDFAPTKDYIDSLIKHNYKNRKYSPFQRKVTENFESQSQKTADLLLSLPVSQKAGRNGNDDLKTIKSKWLINHIDNAFLVWKTSKFSKQLSFFEFKEIILPYRSLYEDLDVTSNYLRNKLGRVIYSGNSNQKIDEVIKRLNFYMYCLDVFEDTGRKLGNFGFYDIIQFYKYDCDRHSEWTVRALNACGIPATLEFTTGFFNRNKLHYGVSVRDTSGKFLHFTPKWQPLGDTAHSVMFSKIFRRTFSPQISPYNLRQSSEDVPFIFSDPFIRDVTDLYHKVVTLEIPLPYNFPKNKSLAYLAIFTPTGWRPIGWGTVEQKTQSLKFEKVPVNSSYIVGYYENKSVVPVSAPFFVDDKGGLSWFLADFSDKIILHLERKYPEKKQFIKLMNTLVGAIIQGSNDSTFSKAADLYTLKYNDIADFQVVPLHIQNKEKFRYFRCVTTNKNPLNIATLEFYTNAGYPMSNFPGSQVSILSKPKIDRNVKNIPNLVRVNGKPIANGQAVEKAFDMDNESFVNSYSVGIDLGEKFRITEVRFAPRNSNNGIVPGDVYELFYFNSGWNSLGRKIAEYNFLTYTDVPKNTIYWLRNLTRGKEEQLFTYKNGRQYFLNTD